MTVLLVDDSLANLTIFGEVLQPYYNVRVANSGQRALEVVDTDPVPDMILLDVMMPHMDGYAVLQSLRDNPRHRDIPVIFVTAVDENENEEFGLALGAVDFISKPIKPALLLARVKTHLTIKTEHDVLVRQIEFLQEEIARYVAENKQLTRDNLDALKTMEAMNSLFATKSLNELANEPAKKIGDTYFQELDIAPELNSREPWQG
jgi:putative two-component system response regulator